LDGGADRDLTAPYREMELFRAGMIGLGRSPELAASILRVLSQVITAAPFPDLHLCVSLLDDRPSSANAEEPDPLPSILPQLQQLYALLQQCRFPALWILYLSEDYRVLREEYIVESVSFEDSVRKVVVCAVKAAFTKIGVRG
jgi:translation initiation factor 3 subunit K